MWPFNRRSPAAAPAPVPTEKVVLKFKQGDVEVVEHHRSKEDAMCALNEHLRLAGTRITLFATVTER